jgi:hypothetical protein
MRHARAQRPAESITRIFVTYVTKRLPGASAKRGQAPIALVGFEWMYDAAHWPSGIIGEFVFRVGARYEHYPPGSRP